MRSIIQKEKRCIVSGSVTGLHKHHIFGGYNRDNSEKYGLWVWLRWDFHIADSPHPTPHNNKEADLYLKRLGQTEFEKNHSREEFISIFGKNYL